MDVKDKEKSEESGAETPESIAKRAAAQAIADYKAQEAESSIRTKADPAVDPYDFSEYDNLYEDDGGSDIRYSKQGDENTRQQPDPRIEEIGGTVKSLSDKYRSHEEMIKENTRVTHMTNFMYDLDREIHGFPDYGNYREEAIKEAQRAISRGDKVPAADVLSWLHGKDLRTQRSQKSSPESPSIGGSSDLSPSGEPEKIDLDSMTVEEMKEKFGHIKWT